MFRLSLVLLALSTTQLFADAPKKLLLVGQSPDGHPVRTHEYMPGVNIVEKLLKPNKGIEITIVKADDPWKEGPELLERADGVVFFVGSVFFTFAAALELREATLRLGRWSANPSWWSAAVQFAGTLLFNLNTFDAMQDSLSAEQENRLVFAPDLIGSACFLASGVLAYRAATGPEHRMAAVNLAGCVLFGISALASYVVPSTGSVLDLAAVNWCTALGALCFFAGSLMLLPRKSTVLKEA